MSNLYNSPARVRVKGAFLKPARISKKILSTYLNVCYAVIIGLRIKWKCFYEKKENRLLLVLTKYMIWKLGFFYQNLKLTFVFESLAHP